VRAAAGVPPMNLSDEEIEQLPPIPAEEAILAFCFVEIYVRGSFSAALQTHLLICTNYAYYLSRGPVDTATFDGTGYSSARILKAFAERITCVSYLSRFASL
jgi:hypothetical protein